MSTQLTAGVIELGLSSRSGIKGGIRGPAHAPVVAGYRFDPPHPRSRFAGVGGAVLSNGQRRGKCLIGLVGPAGLEPATDGL